MGRPSIDNDAVYVEMCRRLAPLKTRVANAKFEAQQLVEKARADVEREKLAAIRFGLDHGLSQYAIGKATGETRADRQRALVRRALAFEGDY